MYIHYTDSENKKFHPICEAALKRALASIGKSANYEVESLPRVGRLQADFIVRNSTTRRAFCVVEVKRTPSATRSMDAQRQVRTYVTESMPLLEKPYYVLTNLEWVCAFRHDPTRNRLSQQVLKPGFEQIASIATDSKAVLENKLTDYFTTLFQAFMNDRYEYLPFFESFALQMEGLREPGFEKQWKSALSMLLYEHIRGAFHAARRGGTPLLHVSGFGNHVERLCREAVRVNFGGIYDYNTTDYVDRMSFSPSLYQEMFSFGEQDIMGELSANLLHSLVSEDHAPNGEVATDYELGRIVGVLARHVHGAPLQPGEYLCDPAAGSGSLLSASIESFDLQPRQVLANDIQPKYLELLSLRLGLKFVANVAAANAPTVTIKDIASLDRAYFEHTPVVVLNPPFVAGTRCRTRKRSLLDAIERLTSSRALTDVGQMPLEGPFLELITQLVKPGTTIACILPKTHLVAGGPEARAIRKLLVEKLGMRLLFIYPGEQLFTEVTKDTIVVVGKAMQPGDTQLLTSYKSVPNINLRSFEVKLSYPLTTSFTTLTDDVSGCLLPLGDLRATTETGWRMLSQELCEAQAFVEREFSPGTLSKMLPVHSSGIQFIRGRSLNSGGTALLKWKDHPQLNAAFQSRAVVSCDAIVNATLPHFELNRGDSEFLNAADTAPALVEEMVDVYMAAPSSAGSQPRFARGKAEWVNLVRREATFQEGAPMVLLPRNLRTTGRVHLAKVPLFVSTNFFVFKVKDKDNAIILGSWMATVFYQLLCELAAKDQEGTRKMERNDISNTLVPNVTALSHGLVGKLRSGIKGLTFLNLQDPAPRAIDKIWAKELFGARAEDVLLQATDYLSFLAIRRNS